MKKKPEKNGMKVLADTLRGMPRVADYSSRAAWEKEVWRALAAKLSGLSRSDLIAALTALVTARERSTLVRRAVAIERVYAGGSNQDVGEELWVTRQTISVIKKALREDRYRSYNDRGKTERKKRICSPGPVRPYDPARDPSKRRVRTKYGALYLPR